MERFIKGKSLFSSMGVKKDTWSNGFSEEDKSVRDFGGRRKHRPGMFTYDSEKFDLSVVKRKKV